MYERYYDYKNRTVCGVLKEMRELHNTRNYSSLLSLIEEAQSLANRMEAALGDQRDIREIAEHKSRVKKELRRLEEELKGLENEKEKAEQEK